MAWLLNQNSEDTALVVLKMPDWELEMIPKQKTKLNRSVNYSRNTINENWPTSKDWKTEEVNIMADNASPKTEPRNQRNAGNRPLGMVISKLKPLSSEFYTHFHEKQSLPAPV